MSKRIFDCIASALGLILLSPLLLLAAAAVKLSSPGPVFHRGSRVGKDGRRFAILKFRSMVVNAAAQGPGITAGDDPRITPIGRLLRKTKLDEFPQLINVLRGEMSLVGPRPEDPRYVSLYTPEQLQVLSVRPGITSLASVRYRDEESLLSQGSLDEVYTRVVMPAKLAIELEYLQHRSLLQDVLIIFQTLAALFHRNSSTSPNL